MGLATTHNCWRGSYLMFNKFKYDLVMQILVDFNESLGKNEEEFILSNSIFQKIKPLLHHSDCEGELSPEECEQIAKGLDRILDGFSDEIAEESELFRKLIIRFRNGCIAASQRNETVFFG